jgi:hypothetical protein
MPYKMQIGAGGAALHRNDASVLSSGRCCCLCECIGSTVSVTIPSFTKRTGATGCDCSITGATYTLTLLSTNVFDDEEAGSIRWCVYQYVLPEEIGPCNFKTITLTATTVGMPDSGVWGDHTGITFFLSLNGLEDGITEPVLALFSGELSCDEIQSEELLPGVVTMEVFGEDICEPSGDATVSVDGTGCCAACAACNWLTEGQTRPDIRVEVNSLIAGTYEDACTHCPDVFGDWEVPYDPTESASESICIYTFLIDPAPEPSNNCEATVWEAACSLTKVRIELIQSAPGGIQQTYIRVLLLGTTLCGEAEGTFVIGVWTDTVAGWRGVYSIPWDYTYIDPGLSNDYCLPNATAPDATVTIRCFVDPPEPPP